MSSSSSPSIDQTDAVENPLGSTEAPLDLAIEDGLQDTIATPEAQIQVQQEGVDESHDSMNQDDAHVVFEEMPQSRGVWTLGTLTYVLLSFLNQFF